MDLPHLTDFRILQVVINISLFYFQPYKNFHHKTWRNKAAKSQSLDRD